MWLGCMAMTCAVAMGSEQQVIVEGAQRASETVRVSGQRVPLLHALEQIVPASYSVNVPNAGTWADTPVSWHAGGSFVRVLGEMLSANPQLQARVNTDLRIVTVSAVPQRADANAAAREPAPGAPVDAAAQRAAAPAVTAVAPPASLAPDESAIAAPLSAVNTHAASATTPKLPTTPAAAPAAPAASIDVAGPPGQPLTQGVPPAGAIAGADAASAPQAQQVWELRESDGSVRNALQRWAREAGWQFVWDVPTDFTVDANATIHGSLDEALREVVDALSNAQVPIQIVMYKGNRVLRVIPKGAG